MKKIVVFGGSGFLGKYLCIELINAKYKVVNFDIKSFKLSSKNYKFFKGNILNKKKIYTAIKNAHIVVNLAGISDLEICKKNPILSAKMNIIGNLNILDACVKNRIKNFLYASSLYSFSDQGSFYKCTKLSAEVYIKEFSKTHGLKYLILRFGSIYGEGAGGDNGINRILLSIIKKNKIIYNGFKNAERSYMHASDVSKSTIQILKKKFDNSTFVLKGKKTIKIKDLLQMLKKRLGLKYKIIYGKNLMTAHYILSPKPFVLPKTKEIKIREKGSLDNKILKLFQFLRKRKKS